MFRIIPLIVAISIAAQSAIAAPDPATICDAVADIAAREAGLPPSMLRALTRTETGRARAGRLTPWPWTVNMEGEGRWFDNRKAALAFAQKHHARGATSFDVGCFQINYRWHSKAFASIDAMFDPLLNARYAAKYLQELKAEGGTWQTAVGRYHSRTPTRAQKYVARFNRIRENLKPFGTDAIYVAETVSAHRKPQNPKPEQIAVAPVPSVPKAPRSPIEQPTPGGVSLIGFSQTVRLLTPARPLFE